MKKTMMALFVFVSLFTGCATFPLSEIIPGRSIEEIKEKINYANFKDVAWPAPDGSNDKWELLVADFFPANCSANCAFQPHWILFVNKKLVTSGMGDEKVAEIIIFSAIVNNAAANKKIDQITADRLLYDKVKSIYGPDPLMDEHYAYRKMIFEKLGKGEISESEADYLFAQKKSEIQLKLRQIQIQEAGVRAQRGMQSLMLMQMGSQMMQQSQPYTMPTNNLNCITQYVGNQAVTNCH